MLEKALISGVVHKREETVYRVEGVAGARLFAALADGPGERRHDRADRRRRSSSRRPVEDRRRPPHGSTRSASRGPRATISARSASSAPA